MADVTESVRVFEQIRLVAGLRWRILRNGLGNKSNRLDLIGLIFTTVLGGILVVGLSFAFFAGGYAFQARGRLEWMTLLFWGIFLFWQLFPVFVAGFGANFPFRALLRFPLSLRTFYIVGLAYGFADFSALASACWLLAMTAGATTAKPGVLPAMLLIVAVFMLLNVTLERLIGSWLERLLARRRTRELFLGIFVLSMISLNFLAPMMERYGASARPVFLRIRKNNDVTTTFKQKKINLLKEGFDPALTAGPFETAFQDVIGVTIFLSLATALLHWLV